MLVQQYLKQTPFDIHIAENGMEAVEKYTSGTYDIVLMDIQMPVKDGFTATREIREFERKNKITPVPVIALTAYAMQEDIARCLAAGCNEHLSKPLKKAKLFEVLSRYLAVEEKDKDVGISTQSAMVEEQLIDKHIVMVEKDFAEFIPGYLEDVLQDITKMTQALALEDFETVRKVSHSIKGAGGGYGLDTVSEISESLETAARNRSNDKVGKALSTLADYVNNVQVEYQ